MPYAIDERNLERQRRLAHLLDLVTVPRLQPLLPARPGRWLDVGAGLGETTRMLGRLSPVGTEIVGLDQDGALLAIARAEDRSARQVSFREGDALALPFDDSSFDVVFSRHLLVHLSEPVKAIREMLRVAKPGALLFACEPDLSTYLTHPPHAALDRLPALFAAVFPEPHAGRKLPHLFREAGAPVVHAAADIGIEHDAVELKQLLRLTYEAVGSRLEMAGRISPQDFAAMRDALLAAEADVSQTLISTPVVSAWTHAPAGVNGAARAWDE